MSTMAVKTPAAKRMDVSASEKPVFKHGKHKGEEYGTVFRDFPGYANELKREASTRPMPQYAAAYLEWCTGTSHSDWAKKASERVDRRTRPGLPSVAEGIEPCIM